MAFLDFLSESPYGTAQGPMPITGNAGVTQGPTWNQILGAAAIGGSRAGLATGLSPLLGAQPNQQGQWGMQGLGTPGQMLQIGPQKQKSNSTGMITTLLGIFGL